MDQLKKRHVCLTERQIKFGIQRGGNLSRYIRTLIDREIGRQEAVSLTREGGLKHGELPY